MSLPLIPLDKANHIIDGGLVSAFASNAAFALGLDPETSRLVGVAASATVGAIKEGSDAYLNWRATGNPFKGPHGVEWGDFFATCGGGLLAQSGGFDVFRLK